MATKTKRRRPIHPGQVLKTVLEGAGITANALALALRIPANRLTEIINRETLDFCRYRSPPSAILRNLNPDVDEPANKV
jgi:hypothetical protein